MGSQQSNDKRKLNAHTILKSFEYVHYSARITISAVRSPAFIKLTKNLTIQKRHANILPDILPALNMDEILTETSLQKIMNTSSLYIPREEK